MLCMVQHLVVVSSWAEDYDLLCGICTEKFFFVFLLFFFSQTVCKCGMYYLHCSATSTLRLVLVPVLFPPLHPDFFFFGSASDCSDSTKHCWHWPELY